MSRRLSILTTCLTFYYKVAELIVALGEVKEANGVINGKMNIIEHYKRIHSRKTAFKSELNSLI